MPVVTIGEVARRTGVSAITLRAWERRYGIPTPVRTPGKYRLYSERQIQEIVSLQRLVASGIAMRQAAFLATRMRVLGSGGASSIELARWRRRLEVACLRFDERAATLVVDEAARQLALLPLLRDLVFPVVATMGDGLRSGVISISQEHFASELARRLVSQRDAGAPVSPRAPAVVTGCAPLEQHELALLYIVAGLREKGTRVVHLGRNVPVDAFLSTTDALGARVAVVSITVASHLRPWIARAAAVQRRARRGLQFVWAGPGAAAAIERGLPGQTSTSIDEVISLAAASVS